ncbi:MerR family transcriptional regulator [Actinomadura alba]|uniref:MerR family transcriptional regulator n=1 Tax=Actinomadura alba TaxID=406431 RepID=A0ABR7LT43_9ACTN|nr:MerR family transcriptional regulator [Actinomadura alba]MBC6468002.1 MerR family transcriptional regulator [Actinomadura alba]
MESTWTITELAAAATTALSGEPAQVNGRVRDMPNERLIRWYTTIGLVDPPAGRRGRIALYGRRHLLQLIAVKRRQAEGRTIAQIQVELAGATDATLRSIARIPSPDAVPDPTFEPEPAHDAIPASAPKPGATPGAAPGAASDTTSDAASDTAQGRRHRFWTPPPASALDLDRAVVGVPRAGTAAGSRPGMGDEESPALVHGVRLAPGVTLLLDGDALRPEDVAVIEIAARPLLDALRDRGLPLGSAPTTPSASTGDGGSEADDSSAQSPTGRST